MPWTYSYPLLNDSIDSISHGSSTYSGLIGTDMWIIADTVYEGADNRMEIIVFNTETREIRSVDFETPDDFENMLETAAFDGDKIYLWRHDEGSDFTTLFKLDTKSEMLTKVVTIESDDTYHGCPIIGDKMYTLEVYHENETMSMYTINLSEEKVISKNLLKNKDLFDSDLHLMLINGQLFLLEMDNENRLMFKIEDYKVQLLSHCRFNGQDSVAKLGREEGCVLYNRARNTEGSFYYKDEFDFVQFTWNRVVAKTPSFGITLAHVEVNGNIYVVVDTSRNDNVEYEVRVFEKLPKLSTICLVSIVEKCLENNRDDELEMVKGILPLHMRGELDNLTNWRRNERRIV